MYQRSKYYQILKIITNCCNPNSILFIWLLLLSFWTLLNYQILSDTYQYQIVSTWNPSSSESLVSTVREAGALMLMLQQSSVERIFGLKRITCDYFPSLFDLSWYSHFFSMAVNLIRSKNSHLSPIQRENMRIEIEMIEIQIWIIEF